MYGSRGPESMFRRVMIQDGAIWIHSHSYSNFQIAIPTGHASWEYSILKPNRSKILTSRLPLTFGSVERITPGPKRSLLWLEEWNVQFTVLANHRVMKPSWFWNNLETYQFFIDGKPTPARLTTWQNCPKLYTLDRRTDTGVTSVYSRITARTFWDKNSKHSATRGPLSGVGSTRDLSTSARFQGLFGQ